MYGVLATSDHLWTISIAATVEVLWFPSVYDRFIWQLTMGYQPFVEYCGQETVEHLGSLAMMRVLDWQTTYCFGGVSLEHEQVKY